jgi:L-fuculose-phosphate aldolase
MQNEDAELRRAIIDQCLWMNARGLNQGTSGNISVRHRGDMLITPSSVPYDDLTPEMICAVPLDDPENWKGPRKPSSEWRFHRDILAARPEFHAIVHTHATHCTALAICRREIPAAHYMIAAFGGPVVRCSDFAIFGSQELSDAALRALEGRNACLLANHGAIACGPDLDRAMWLMNELETLARQYILALQIGDPVILDDAAIAETAAKFGLTGYGRS